MFYSPVVCGTKGLCCLPFECPEIFPGDLVFIQKFDGTSPGNCSRKIENPNGGDETELLPKPSAVAKLAPESFPGRLFLRDGHRTPAAASHSRLKHFF